MFEIHKKITTGFVIQEYITLPDGTLVCQNQSFVAGDQVDYENTDGEAVTVDTLNEVYCPFEMKAPKQIPDPDKEAKFVCPACPSNQLEAVLDGSHTTTIVAIYKGGGIEYGDTESNGDLVRFQCVQCGYIITHDDEDRAPDDQEPITDDDELVEWVEKQ